MGLIPYAGGVPSPVLTTRDLRVAFDGTLALDGIDLQVDPGQVIGLLGPNGAGKTTLIRCCTGLIDPDGGEISVLGSAPASPAALAGVGLMPQATGAWSFITPRRLLPYLASLYADPQPVDELMDLLGIHGFANTVYRQLSGGQQQAVNLAGALIGRPHLVFLDEPTAGLDVRARRNVWDVIRAARDAGVAVLLTTHDMNEAAALSDVVHIIDRGSITISGTVAELTASRSLEDVFLAHTSGDVP